MRILNFSDIHMDHEPAWRMPGPETLPGFDVAVFAGDIMGSPSDGMRWLRRQPGFEHCEIVFVAGNHEYYGRDIGEEREKAAEAAKLTRVHLLDASAVPVIDGVRFLGCTLWTDYELFGDAAHAMQAALRSMNDHRLIRKAWDGQTTRFLPRDALRAHRREAAWLEARLGEPHDGPTVVVTHHGVGPRSVHPRYARDPVTPAFASDLTGLIERHQPELWIHGHTHDGFDYEIGRTRVICNPKGYGPEPRRERGADPGPPENPLFDPLMVVEVPAKRPEPAVVA